MRSNAKVGLLIAPGVAAFDPIVRRAGSPDFSAETAPSAPTANHPVAIVAARAAVRDADIQANTDRYALEFVRDHPISIPWDEERQRVWYYARIYIHCMPSKILWWPDGLSGELVRWEAPADTQYPQSDPPPRGANMPAKDWPSDDWTAVADRVVADIPTPTLTVSDDDGFPLPFPTLSATRTGTGFDLQLPPTAPWKADGPACLTFSLSATFLGAVRSSYDGVHFTVDRVLGNMPLAGNALLPSSSQEAKEALMQRLSYELDRRGQPVPEVRR